MALTVRLPRSAAPAHRASPSPTRPAVAAADFWDPRDGDPPPSPSVSLGRVLLTVFLAIAALAVGVAAYSFSLTRHDLERSGAADAYAVTLVAAPSVAR